MESYNVHTKYEEGIPTGLINLGVTCYMNSFLQNIFHLKNFTDFILKMDNED